jgi:hypothetical protein
MDRPPTDHHSASRTPIAARKVAAETNRTGWPPESRTAVDHCDVHASRNGTAGDRESVSVPDIAAKIAASVLVRIGGVRS